jgi:hypothetical protein
MIEDSLRIFGVQRAPSVIGGLAGRKPVYRAHAGHIIPATIGAVKTTSGRFSMRRR